MSTMKPHLYINSKGFFVTRHSYSGSDSFTFCARKYYLERVQGWSEKYQRSSTFFGTALEKAITFWHQHREDTAAAVAEFVRLWAENTDVKRVKQKLLPLTYTKSDLDWDRLNLTGQELVRLYAIRYPTFPYVVNNPQDFQVETNFEVFPDTKLAGIEFTSYIDLVAQVKHTPTPLIIDIKTSSKDVPEFTVLDPQLRSYSWVKGWPDVAFLWFRKMGRSISKGDTVTFLESCAGLQPGDDALVAMCDDFGIWVTQNQQAIDEMETKFVGDSKAVKALRQQYVEANFKHAPERAITKQRVQFKMATITPESAEDIGRSIKRDVINIAAANEKEFWPMQSGVRFPNEKCPNCAMRGICANKPELRDTLLVRKQMDELDFGKESE
jgi:PD-(D/E)XK nuclease superfamily